MAKSDLIHIQVECNVFEGKADELSKLLEEGGKTVELRVMMTYGNGVSVAITN